MMVPASVQCNQATREEPGTSRENSGLPTETKAPPPPSPPKIQLTFYLPIKGPVSRNSAKLGDYKMPIKLGET